MVQQYFVKKSPVKSVKTSRAKVKKSPKKFSKTPRNPLLSPMLQRRLFRMSDSQSPVRKSPVRKSPVRKSPVRLRMYDYVLKADVPVNSGNLDQVLARQRQNVNSLTSILSSNMSYYDQQHNPDIRKFQSEDWWKLRATATDPQLVQKLGKIDISLKKFPPADIHKLVDLYNESVKAKFYAKLLKKILPRQEPPFALSKKSKAEFSKRHNLQYVSSPSYPKLPSFASEGWYKA